MTSKKTEKLVGKKVQAVLQDHGESQKEAAPELNITPAGLNNIIQGRVESLSQTFLTSFKERYKVNLDWLLDDSRSIKPVLYSSSDEGPVFQMDEDKVLFSKIKNTKGLKEIVKTLLQISPEQRKIIADVASEFSKKK
ncbi:helix-turn-helix transcriptional regulator [Leptospira sp. 201903071]|uniref:helix-turn-helix domain-containing protein n=1 Tax=Leptospira ainazelensis TaxID=2810034 RepID=UPI0019641A18|nr:helix-turn-helix domain-containing protein [Leptospira ainazelensis]MBM9500290.1 helix-turn-helix transcriptional regulator [Leptospira ainazelensis]